MDARERGQVDTSDAALVVIDGRKLKEKCYTSYLDLVDTCSSLYRKSNHERFARPYYNAARPYYNDVDGGLLAHEGKELERGDYYQSYANFAIEEFHRLRKDRKLRLVKLFRVNTAFWGASHFYMTFPALDELSGNTSTYQAALVPLTMRDHVLGLFRDHSNDKILAILSITGAEEDLAAIKKACESDLQCYGEPVKTDYAVDLSECRDLKRFTTLRIGSGNKTTGSGSAMGLKVLLV